MEELKVPTRAVQVEVFTDTGLALRGFFFIGDSRYQSLPPEEELEHVLNDERTFLPFEECGQEIATQRPAILKKSHIQRIELPIEPDSAFLSLHATDAEPCTLLFSDGTCLMGRVVLDAPPAQSRLLDKLNRASQFLPVLTGDSLHMVNLDHVVHVA